MQVRKLAQAGLSYVVAVFIVTSILFQSSILTAQQAESSAEQRITTHLSDGEFSLAIEIAESLPADQADRQFARIAAAQNAGGARRAAVKSAGRIANDQLRFKALFQQGLEQDGGSFSGISRDADNHGETATDARAGGVTEADFQPLINLIRTTIDPDGWNDTNGDGIILAYPAGVYVDPTGTLQRLKIDPKRNLRRLAADSSIDSGNRWSGRSAKLRKVSLNRLEREIQLLASQGLPMTLPMQHLAGLYEIKYVMWLPETNDIVIAGPAGPWHTDADGHAIHVDSGKPVLQIDDLVVCLRNAQATPQGNNGKFGCSITPRKQNLAATRKFLQDSPLKGAAWRRQLRETLGQQDIEVFGVDAATHAGRVLVEADYRMKLVAMGLEESIPQIPSYLSRLTVGDDGTTRPMDVVRWWFTMNYEEVIADEKREVFSLTGPGVKVLSENEFINEQGDRIHTGQSDGPTAGFARDFTLHFNRIADKYPVYRRLKNLFDLAIVSALIRHHGLDRKAEWHLTYFGNDPDHVDHIHQPVTAAVPTQVDSVMNHLTITQRQRSRTLKHTLVGVSGGITFDSIQVLRSKSRVSSNSSELAEITEHVEDGNPSGHWWWD